MVEYRLNAFLRGAIMMVFAPTLYHSPQTAALPVSSVLTKITPWAHPCTPYTKASNGNPGFISVTESPAVIRDRLAEKAEETLYHGRYIEEDMEERFKDPEIIKYLRQRTISGFPIVTTEHGNYSQNTSDVYSRHYEVLSKVAVFLEQIHQDEDETEMKSELEDLLFENLSQMCQLRLALYSGSVPVPGVAPRSIMTTEERHPSSTFKRYERDFTAMVQYRRLLQTHFTQYKQIKV